VSSITWFRKSLGSGTPCLKFLPSLFIVNAMSCQMADKSAMIICATGAKTFPSGRVTNFEVWLSKL